MIAIVPRGERWPAYVLTLLIATATCGLLGDLIFQLIERGPFGWHLSRDATWQGGLEVLALAALLALAAAAIRAPRWRIVLLLGIGELYLRRHAVDAPLALDVLYVELWIGLGAALARRLGVAPARDVPGYLKLAIAGIVVWSVGAWALSAFGLGSLNALRAYTLLLAIPAIAARRTPLTLFVARRFSTLDGASRATVAAFGAWFLGLFARTNVANGFDSWWYGLRGEDVLVASGSVFRSLGLVAPVHYYPKLYELMLIPVSALRDTSVIEGVSIAILGFFALVVAEIAKALGCGFRTRALIAAIAATTPAIANIALSPKPDLFAALMLLFACLEAPRFARDGSKAAAAWCVAACLLALASKLSAPPFVVAIAVATIVVWYRNGRPRIVDAREDLRFALAIAIGALLLAIAVTARTWMLAGVPVIAPQSIVDLFGALGMPLKAPVGKLLGGPPVDWAGEPRLLFEQLFRPQKLSHMIITWIGNVWLYLFALAIVARVLAGKSGATHRASPIWIAVAATGVAVFVLFRTTERGGDGNYFVLPIALAIVLGAYVALRALPAGIARRTLIATLPMFVLIQAAYCFISADWSTGTRAFDTDLKRSVRDLRKDQWTRVQYAGIAGVSEYLRVVHGTPRAVGYVADAIAFRLPGTFETLTFYEYWYRAPLRDADTLMAYLAAHGIDYLVMPRPGVKIGNPISAAALEAERRYRAMPDVKTVDDRNYVLYDLAAHNAAERAAAVKKP
jgi:hypothetical protein